MEITLKKLLFKPQESNETVDAIREIRRQIDTARSRFEMESDGDLIESCIYELEALDARYRFLLKQAKANGICANPSYSIRSS